MANRDDRGGTLTRRPEGTLSRQDGNRFLFGNPWRDLEEMQQRMDALFSRAFGFGWPDSGLWNRGGDGNQQNLEPDVDIFESNDEYLIHAALPGIRPEDIQVQATDSTILVTAQSRSPFESQDGQGSRNAPNQSSGAGATPQAGAAQDGNQMTSPPLTQHRQSRYSRQSRFEFSYTLPEEIQPNEVRANFRNGRLELQLPKADNARSRVRPVSIPVGSDAQNTVLPAGTSTQNTGNSGATQSATDQEHQRRNNQTTPQTGQTPSAPRVTSGADKSS